MIQLMKKQLFPEQMKILYQKPFTPQTLEQDFEIKGGEWYVENGWLTGKNKENFAAMVISKADYYGPLFMEFDARTIPPCTHDINVMWHGSWNLKSNTRDVAYVAGLQGWWDGKVGFEKSPEYQFNVGTQLFPFEPGRQYHMAVGDIRGHIFVVVDGQLVLEITDPNPIDDCRFGKIGFEAYCSQLQFKNLCIREAVYQPDEKSYTPEFE